MSRLVLAFASLITVGGGAAACGGSPAPTPVPSAPVASIVAPRASDADVVVAEVNGRPVWGSCVTEQAATGATGRTAALEQCIDFELLAQAAEKRGFTDDVDVQRTTRTAMVNELIGTEFEARYQKPADLGPVLDAFIDKNEWRLHRPDLRASTYVRAVVPADATPEVDAVARQVADKIVAELEGEKGLLPPHLKTAAERAKAGTSIEIDSQDLVQIQKTASYEKPYIDALFSIPEVGRISQPARTKRGWDVVLWSAGMPPQESTREQLASDVFPELRRAQFYAWVTQLTKASGIRVELDPDSATILGEEPK